MLFRQLAHKKSSTLSYLVASRRGGEAVFIDPVRDHLDLYLRLIEALDLRLVFAIDTHRHTDHDSALEALLDCTQCVTAMGQESRAECVARHLSDGEVIDLDGTRLEAMYTPGHTDDSYSFVMDDRVFTGDTLLIRGTGRTDQGGDPRQQYDSLFSKLLELPGRTLVYPAHDYNGRHVSSIADERRHNPRLQLESVDEYVSLMESLRPHTDGQMDMVELPSLRPSGALVRELSAVRAALSPPSAIQ
jgi:glyoxylase-like metal-dependent hydrolase (beta-lactamase superfamily II)